MNFTAYIERQKRIIRERHAGETYLTHKGETFTVSESEKLLYELSNSRGLNVRERAAYSRAV